MSKDNKKTLNLQQLRTMIRTIANEEFSKTKKVLKQPRVKKKLRLTESQLKQVNILIKEDYGDDDDDEKKIINKNLTLFNLD